MFDVKQHGVLYLTIFVIVRRTYWDLTIELSTDYR